MSKNFSNIIFHPLRHFLSGNIERDKSRTVLLIRSDQDLVLCRIRFRPRLGSGFVQDRIQIQFFFSRVRIWILSTSTRIRNPGKKSRGETENDLQHAITVVVAERWQWSSQAKESYLDTFDKLLQYLYKDYQNTLGQMSNFSPKTHF